MILLIYNTYQKTCCLIVQTSRKSLKIYFLHLNKNIHNNYINIYVSYIGLYILQYINTRCIDILDNNKEKKKGDFTTSRNVPRQLVLARE